MSNSNNNAHSYHYLYSSGPPVIQNSPYYYSSHNERLSSISASNGGEWQGSSTKQLSQEREAHSKEKLVPRNKQLPPPRDRSSEKISFNKSSPHFFPSQQNETGSSNLIPQGTSSQIAIKDNEKISQIQKIYNNNIRSRHNLHKSQNNFYNTHSNTFFNQVNPIQNTNSNGSSDTRAKKARPNQNPSRKSQSPSTETKQISQQYSQQNSQQQQLSSQQLSQLPLQYQSIGTKKPEQLAVKATKQPSQQQIHQQHQQSPPLASFQKENSNFANSHSKEFKSSRSSVNVGKKEILMGSAPTKQPQLKGYLQSKSGIQSGPPASMFFQSSSSSSKFYQTEPNFNKKSSKKLFAYSNQPPIKTQLIPIEDLIVSENMSNSGQIGRKYFTNSTTQPNISSAFFSIPPKSNSFFTSSSSSSQRLGSFNPTFNAEDTRNPNKFERHLLANDFQNYCKNMIKMHTPGKAGDEEKNLPKQLASLETQQLYSYDVKMDEPLSLLKRQRQEKSDERQKNEEEFEQNINCIKERRNNNNNMNAGVAGLEVIQEHHKEDDVREVPIDLIQQVQKISESRPKTSEGGRRRRKLRSLKQEKERQKEIESSADCQNDCVDKEQNQGEGMIENAQFTEKNSQKDEQKILNGSPKRLDFSPLKSNLFEFKGAFLHDFCKAAQLEQEDKKAINSRDQQYVDDFNNDNNPADEQDVYDNYENDFEDEYDYDQNISNKPNNQLFRSQAEFYRPTAKDNQFIEMNKSKEKNVNIFRKTTNEGFNNQGQGGQKNRIFGNQGFQQNNEDNYKRKEADLPIEVHVQEDDKEYVYQETEQKKKKMITKNKKTIDSDDGYKIIIRHNKSAAGPKRVQKIEKNKESEKINENNSTNQKNVQQNVDEQVAIHEAQDDVVERVVVPFKTALDNEFINLFAAAQQFQ